MRIVTLRLSLAFFLGLILTIIPLPEFTYSLRPLWMLLLILYLQFYMPNYFRIPILVFVGIFLDVLLFSTFGEHVFALAVVLWLANSKARRFYFFSIYQQMLLIGLLSLIYELILVTIDAFLGFDGSLLRLVFNPLLSLLIWPWVRLICEQTLFNKMQKI